MIIGRLLLLIMIITVVVSCSSQHQESGFGAFNIKSDTQSIESLSVPVNITTSGDTVFYFSVPQDSISSIAFEVLSPPEQDPYAQMLNEAEVSTYVYDTQECIYSYSARLEKYQHGHAASADGQKAIIYRRCPINGLEKPVFIENTENGTITTKPYIYKYWSTEEKNGTSNCDEFVTKKNKVYSIILRTISDKRSIQKYDVFLKVRSYWNDKTSQGA